MPDLFFASLSFVTVYVSIGEDATRAYPFRLFAHFHAVSFSIPNCLSALYLLPTVFHCFQMHILSRYLKFLSILSQTPLNLPILK